MPTKRDPDFPELLIIDFPGGCPMVVDPQKPHLGGNMRGGDANTDYGATLWPWIINNYHPQVLMDVGCAEGHALRWFADKGVKAIGVEGLVQNAKRCREPVLVHDLTTGPVLVQGVDAIWCCDVVEHVEEKYIDNVLTTLRQAPICFLIHGTQEHDVSGWHHVNNQGHEYWIEKMESVGMMYDKDGTAKAKEVAGEGWFMHSGKIFKRKDG
jgi:hypothetical protein